jgi:hypothetical protein
VVWLLLASSALQSLTAGIETEIRMGIQALITDGRAGTSLSASQPTDDDGIYFVFPNVLITNHGLEPLALTALMRVEWPNGQVSGHLPTLRRFPIEGWVPGPSPFAEDPPFEFPLNLAPRSSVQGSIGFLITQAELDEFGATGLLIESGATFVYLTDLLSEKDTLIWTNQLATNS